MEAGVNYFLKRYAQFGEKVPTNVALKQTIRVNTLRMAEEAVVQRLESLGVKLSKIDWLKHGYTVDYSKFSLGAAVEALLGYYYVQEAAAQVPVEVLDPQPGELVLDCCASPGGKTTQIAQTMWNKGTVVALEKKDTRLISLRSNLERCGVTNTVVYHMDAVKAGKLGLQFDKILVDAPCSGNFVGDSRWFEKRTMPDILKSQQFQRGILKAALDVLKPGGTLVYSTCSLEPEENEMNMHWLAENFPIKLESTGLKVGDPGLSVFMGKALHKDVAKCRRFWPHKTQTEGFFVAKMVKQ